MEHELGHMVGLHQWEIDEMIYRCLATVESKRTTYFSPVKGYYSDVRVHGEDSCYRRNKNGKCKLWAVIK
jgi:hypothetical protein